MWSLGEKREDGVTDGARTRDNQYHKLGLYQLSYGHHLGANISASVSIRQVRGQKDWGQKIRRGALFRQGIERRGNTFSAIA